MAIINSFTYNGVTYPQAYIQVSYHKLNSKETNLDLQAANPVDYGYKLLEASGEFTKAAWNV